MRMGEAPNLSSPDLFCCRAGYSGGGGGPQPGQFGHPDRRVSTGAAAGGTMLACEVRPPIR